MTNKTNEICKEVDINHKILKLFFIEINKNNLKTLLMEDWNVMEETRAMNLEILKDTKMEVVEKEMSEIKIGLNPR